VQHCKNYFNYKAMNVQGIKEELNVVDWQRELVRSVDEIWNKFKVRLLQLRDKYVPIFRPSNKKKEVWLNYKENTKTEIIQHVSKQRSKC